MRRWLTVWIAIAFLAVPAIGQAACDQRISPRVQNQKDGDALVVCNSGEFDFRGYPSKASVSADTENPSGSNDTSVITVQLQADDGNNLTQQSVIGVLLSDTTTAGAGVTAIDGGLQEGGSGADTGAILVRHVSKAYFDLQTQGTGKAVFTIGDSRDTNRWVNLIMPTGEIITGPKIDFD